MKKLTSLKENNISFISLSCVTPLHHNDKHPIKETQYEEKKKKEEENIELCLVGIWMKITYWQITLLNSV